MLGAGTDRRLIVGEEACTHGDGKDSTDEHGRSIGNGSCCAAGK
jgi:hypothetical protein